MPANPALRTAFSVYNGFAPKEEPKALPIVLDFTENDIVEIDLLQENTQGVIQFVQSAWIDNSDNPNPMIATFGVVQQRIVVPPFAHGMWPVISIDQTQARFQSIVGPQSRGQVILLNVPAAYTQGGPFTANVTASLIEPVTTTDASGTITVGGASQQVFAANANRKGFLIQNPTTAFEPLYVNFGDPATDSDSVTLLPGQIFPPNGSPYVSTEAININGPTTGNGFIAKEFA